MCESVFILNHSIGLRHVFSAEKEREFVGCHAIYCLHFRSFAIMSMIVERVRRIKCCLRVYVGESGIVVSLPLLMEFMRIISFACTIYRTLKCEMSDQLLGFCCFCVIKWRVILPFHIFCFCFCCFVFILCAFSFFCIWNARPLFIGVYVPYNCWKGQRAKNMRMKTIESSP